MAARSSAESADEKSLAFTLAAVLGLVAIGVAAAIPDARDGLYFANIALAGILVGKEVTTRIVITPAARSLSVPEEVKLQQALGPPFRNLGPVVFNLVLFTGIALAATVPTPGRWLEIAGSVCIVVMLFFVFKISVPINIWTGKQTGAVDPDEWYAQRRRWDSIQLVRLALDGLALACFILALLVNTT